MATSGRPVTGDPRRTKKAVVYFGQGLRGRPLLPLDYRRGKRSLEDKLDKLVVLGIDNAKEYGKLLMAMLDAIYVDTVEEKSVVAIWRKPAFRPIFEVVTTSYGSDLPT